jgi:hypothetical protein
MNLILYHTRERLKEINKQIILDKKKETISNDRRAG